MHFCATFLPSSTLAEASSGPSDSAVAGASVAAAGGAAPPAVGPAGTSIEACAGSSGAISLLASRPEPQATIRANSTEAKILFSSNDDIRQTPSGVVQSRRGRNPILPDNSN